MNYLKILFLAGMVLLSEGAEEDSCRDESPPGVERLVEIGVWTGGAALVTAGGAALEVKSSTAGV